MRFRKTWLQLGLLVIIALAGGLAVGNTLMNSGKAPQTGGRAPPFRVKSLEGTEHTLAGLAGKPVVLNFWGTFCPPCTEEMPALQKQSEKWADRNVTVIGMNLGESAVTVRSFVREYGIGFPVYLDSDDTVRKAYGVHQYPTTFFIQPDGKIFAIKIGQMDEPYIERTVAAMLDGR